MVVEIIIMVVNSADFLGPTLGIFQTMLTTTTTTTTTIIMEEEEVMREKMTHRVTLGFMMKVAILLS